MSEVSNKTRGTSIIITAIAAVLVISLLFLSFSFEIKKEPLPIVIELALSESNYGNNTEGNTPTEPLPAKESIPTTTQTENTKPITETTSQVKSKSVTQTNKPAPAVSNNVSEKKEVAPKPTGDARAKSALENILGGKGSQKSSGQGNGTSSGNIGDPKGNSDQGDNIGENWKTRIPNNQSHNCGAGGVVIVDIIVNANGGIKRATPQLSASECLSKTAKSLVLKYVSAYPGKDNRRGSYRVILR